MPKMTDLLNYHTLISLGFKVVSNYKGDYNYIWYENEKFIFGYSSLSIDEELEIKFIYKGEFNHKKGYKDCCCHLMLKESEYSILDFIYAMADHKKFPLFVNYKELEKIISDYMENNIDG